MRASANRIWRSMRGGSSTPTDAILAGAVAVPSVVQVLVAPIASTLAGLVIAVGSTLPVAFRRSHPVLAVAAGTAVWLIPSDGFLLLGYVAAFILYYSLGRETGSARSLAGGLAIGLALGTAGTAIHDGVFADFAGAYTVLLTATGAGMFVRRERRRTDRLEELTLHLEEERERGAQLAVVEERARIARELHDLVSHAISVIAIQADAAEATLERDPKRVHAPLAAIKSSAGEALREMRRLLGVLREDGAGGELSPLPGMDQVPELVRRTRGTGVPVDLEISGAPRPLPVSEGISGYRIVQEALTNVRKHAPGASATVRLDWAPAALQIEIVDDGPGSDAAVRTNGGHGVVGMRERARLHGGSVEAGPLAGGGYRVRAMLPLSAQEPTP